MRSKAEVAHKAKYLKRSVGLKGPLAPGELTAAAKAKQAKKLAKGTLIKDLPDAVRLRVDLLI